MSAGESRSCPPGSETAPATKASVPLARQLAPLRVCPPPSLPFGPGPRRRFASSLRSSSSPRESGILGFPRDRRQGSVASILPQRASPNGRRPLGSPGIRLRRPGDDDERPLRRVRLRAADQFPHHPRHVPLAEQQEARASRTTASRPSSRSGSPAAGRPSPSPAPPPPACATIDAAPVIFMTYRPSSCAIFSTRLVDELAGVRQLHLDEHDHQVAGDAVLAADLTPPCSPAIRRPGRCGTSTVRSRWRIVSHRNRVSGVRPA